MIDHTRRIFLIIVFTLPVLYFFTRKPPNPEQIETEDGFILVNGWLLKREDILLKK
jgi:hypothetical protein